MSEINLLTNREKTEQKLSFILKILNVVMGITLVVVGGLSYYFYTLYAPLQQERARIDSRLESLKKEISGYSNEELMLRDLKARYDVASKFYSEKIAFERIMVDIYLRNTSGGVQIKTINFDNAKSHVSIRVVSDSTSFKRFVDNLKAEKVNDRNIPNLFSSSGIAEDVNEVTKENVVTVKYNLGALNAGKN